MVGAVSGRFEWAKEGENMSKMSIEWHKQCLENMSRSLEGDRKQLDRDIKRYERGLGMLEFCRMQIDSAVAEGKDSFDAERYKVKKEKKVT